MQQWGYVLATVTWVQRDSLFLKIVDGVAVIFAAMYAIVYFREKAGPARPRRLRSAGISAIGLVCFAVFLAMRVFVLHE
jgi:hypothetical protein